MFVFLQISNNSYEAPLNITKLVQKLGQLIDTLQTFSSVPVDTGYNLRIFNETLWQGIIERLSNHINGSLEQLM